MSSFARTNSSRTGLQAVIWLGLFAALAALLGGSARFDMVQNAALRPLGALFLIPALYYLTTERVRLAAVPLILLAALTAWTALQLVPLPPSMWQALPGRETIAELDAIHGIGDTWRPIAWVPMRGWNALAALAIPVTAALLAAALRPSVRTLMLIIIAIGFADAVLGLLQSLGEAGGPLYLYSVTNAGSPVGLFANENHSAMLSALVLLIIARVAFLERKPGRSPVLSIALGAAFVIVLLAVLVSGSRAGLGLGLVALVSSAMIAWLCLARPQLQGEAASPIALIAQRPRTVLAIGFAAIAALFTALFQFERVPGVIDAMNQNAFEDLRWRIVPILNDLMATHWLLGSGFGSFDAVFMEVEPTVFQGPAYLNQAHNDWAQLVIEGGVPAVAILLALILWASVAIRTIFAREPAAFARCVFWATVLAILAAASLVDYPLRTPLFQVIGVWLIVALAFDASEAGPRNHKK